MNFFDNQIVPNNIPLGKSFLVWLSHDVDRVQKYFLQNIKFLVKQGDFRQINELFSKSNPYWNFESIMNLEEKYGAKSTFFFLNESLKVNPLKPKTLNLGLGRYNIQSPKIQDMIRLINQNGWEVGLHGSYNSYNNYDLLKSEKDTLENIVGVPIQGCRQHYLNLDIPKTWELQSKLGLQYDASFGLTKDIGYRDNVYYPFRPLNDSFIVFPVTIMDGPLFGKSKNLDETWDYCTHLIDLTQKKKGVLSLIWHQRVFSGLEFKGYKEIYERILNECTKRKALFITGKTINDFL